MLTKKLSVLSGLAVLCLLVYIKNNICLDSYKLYFCDSLKQDTGYDVIDDSQYVHQYKDTDYTGFDVSKVRLNFLPYFKNPCWLEEPGDDVYKDNLFVTQTKYPKRTKLGAQILRYRSTKGNQIQLSHGHTGTFQNYRIRCLPYFMLIGVAKSGTSDINARILNHPQIFGGTNKELYWWSQLRFNLLGASLGDYADLFETATAHILRDKVSASPSPSSDDNNSKKINEVGYYPSIIGEFTSMTFYDFAYWRQNPANAGLKEPKVLNPYDIHEALPNMKLIVILRNPTSRLYSHYNLFRSKSPEDFHQRVVGSIWWWETCIKKLPRRNCAFGSPPEMPPIYSALGDRSQWWRVSYNYSGELRFGMYAIQAREWLDVFPRENILFLKMEEYSKDLEKAYNEQIFTFLDIDRLTGKTLETLVERKTVFKRSYRPMLQETKDILDKFYAPFNVELANLLNDDKWLWKD